MTDAWRVEPNYEAAAERLDAEIGGDIASTLRKWPNLVHDVARLVVDAAIGDKLLIDHPTEEEPSDV